MDEVEIWIDESARNQHLSIRKASEQEAQIVRNEAMSRYVSISNPRVWWVNLARPIDECYDGKATKLSQVLPSKSGACWFIPETHMKPLPVYEIDVGQVERLIDDCPAFEYNIVSKDFSWLVIETDHHQYYVCRDSDHLPTLLR